MTDPKPSPSPWFVYLLTCADDTLYCGVTTDPKRRLAQHNAGTASKYTRVRRPVQMTHIATFADKSSALKVEYAVKQQPKGAKAAYLATQAREAGNTEE